MVIVRFDLYTGLYQCETYTKSFDNSTGTLILQAKEVFISKIGNLPIEPRYFDSDTENVIVDLKPCASPNLHGAKQSMFNQIELGQVRKTLEQNKWTLV